MCGLAWEETDVSFYFLIFFVNKSSKNQKFVCIGFEKRPVVFLPS